MSDQIKFLDKELSAAELQLNVLWRAMTLAQKEVEQIVEERDSIFSRFDVVQTPPQLPTEIVMQIAGYLRWDHTNRGKDSYSSLRRMACAFSVVDGMEDALLLQIPLVLFETTADMKGHDSEWVETFETLPPSQRQIIGDNPRFCRYDDEDTISRIGLNEEVHLVLPSETHASKVSARLFQMNIRHFHISLVNSSGETDFRDFIDSFLDPKLLPRISSLTIAQELWDDDEESSESRWHGSIKFQFSNEPASHCQRCLIGFPFLSISRSWRLPSPTMSTICQRMSSITYTPFVRRCEVCVWLVQKRTGCTIVSSPTLKQ